MAVVPAKIITKLFVPVEKVLQGAIDAGLTDIVICGYDADGNDYFAASSADACDVNWHLDRAKWRLMQCVDDLEDGDV